MGEFCKDKKNPLSKFISETVEASLGWGDTDSTSRAGKGVGPASRGEPKARDELKLNTLVLDKYEAKLYKLRYDAISKPKEFNGIRKHDVELVAILKRGRTLDG
jgi:hypothetical protein